MQPDLPIFCAKTYIKVSGHIKDFPFFLIDKYRKLSPEELNAKESSVNMFLKLEAGILGNSFKGADAFLYPRTKCDTLGAAHGKFFLGSLLFNITHASAIFNQTVKRQLHCTF